ncbi:MAG: LPXTG cell wall anchor domain-containing protein [Adlercreutzia equolifaciens]
MLLRATLRATRSPQARRRKTRHQRAGRIPTPRVVEGSSDDEAARAEAQAASEDGVLALPQTGDENDIAFSIALLLGALAAVGAAVALRNMRRQ